MNCCLHFLFCFPLNDAASRRREFPNALCHLRQVEQFAAQLTRGSPRVSPGRNTQPLQRVGIFARPSWRKFWQKPVQAMPAELAHPSPICRPRDSGPREEAPQRPTAAAPRKASGQDGEASDRCIDAAGRSQAGERRGVGYVARNYHGSLRAARWPIHVEERGAVVAPSVARDGLSGRLAGWRPPFPPTDQNNSSRCSAALPPPHRLSMPRWTSPARTAKNCKNWRAP